MNTTESQLNIPATSADTARGVSSRIVTITKEWAAELLQKNTKNRPMSPRYVRQYIHDMQKDKWQLNGESIKISSEGVILDGQKRLQACLDTGRPFETVLITGLDPIVFATIDTGQKRTAAHTLHVLGEKHSNKLGAVLRFVGRFYAERRMTNLSFTNEEIESLLMNHPLVSESIEFVVGYKKRSLIAPFAVLAGVHYLLARAKGPDAANAFMDRVITGLGFTGERDPIYQFRERMSAGGEAKVSEVACAALLIKAWNYVQEGREEKYLRWRGTGEGAEQFPVPIGLQDAEPEKKPEEPTSKKKVSKKSAPKP